MWIDTMFWHQSDTSSIIKVGKCSGLCSDVLVNMCSDILFGIYSGNTSDILYGIWEEDEEEDRDSSEKANNPHLAGGESQHVTTT